MVKCLYLILIIIKLRLSSDNRVNRSINSILRVHFMALFKTHSLGTDHDQFRIFQKDRTLKGHPRIRLIRIPLAHFFLILDRDSSDPQFYARLGIGSYNMQLNRKKSVNLMLPLQRMWLPLSAPHEVQKKALMKQRQVIVE